MVYTCDEKKTINTLWSDIENMTEEEYRTFCLKEAKKEVDQMSKLQWTLSTLRTIYWLSPLGFLFSNHMSLQCYRLIHHALFAKSKIG